MSDSLGAGTVTEMWQRVVEEVLQRAVVELAEPRYQRKESDSRCAAGGLSAGRCTWPTRNCPSRCRECATWPAAPKCRCAPTRSCKRLGVWDEGPLLRIMKGIATRNYEACAETVPEAFGLSRSSVSRRYMKGTARKLAQFQERSLEGYDLVALFLDGKSLADEEIIIALGVTRSDRKRRHTRSFSVAAWLFGLLVWDQIPS